MARSSAPSTSALTAAEEWAGGTASAFKLGFLSPLSSAVGGQYALCLCLGGHLEAQKGIWTETRQGVADIVEQTTKAYDAVTYDSGLSRSLAFKVLGYAAAGAAIFATGGAVIPVAVAGLGITVASESYEAAQDEQSAPAVDYGSVRNKMPQLFDALAEAVRTEEVSIRDNLNANLNVVMNNQPSFDLSRPDLLNIDDDSDFSSDNIFYRDQQVRDMCTTYLPAIGNHLLAAEDHVSDSWAGSFSSDFYLFGHRDRLQRPDGGVDELVPGHPEPARGPWQRDQGGRGDARPRDERHRPAGHRRDGRPRASRQGRPGGRYRQQLLHPLREPPGRNAVTDSVRRARRPRRSLTLVAVTIVAVTAVIAVGVAIAVTGRSGEPDGADDARPVALDYLAVLADPNRAVADLTDLVDDGHPEQVTAGAAALATATERIVDPTLGDPVADDVAHTDAERRYDDFLRFPVSYRLQDEEHSASLTLGRPRGADEWVVVTPLSGTIGPAVPSDPRPVPVVTVANEPTIEAALPPAVYETEARVGSWYLATAEVAVVAGEDTASVAYDLQPTDAGRDAVRRQALTAFDPCRRGSARCPVATQVELPAGSWLGLSKQPTVTLRGLEVTLTGGTFDYRTPDGVRRVPFEASGTVTVDPTSGTPTLSQPLQIDLRVA